MVVTDLGSRLPLPPGERIELAGRGTTFVRVAKGPPSAPTVLLLHGWIATGGLNWLHAFGPLSARYNVIAPDQRGHGRGIRARGRFRLADCADDMAALLDHLHTGPVIAAGYSMGGPIAQLLWRRHPRTVSGLVLCATSCRFVTGMRERFIFSSMMATAVGTTRAGQLLTRVPAGPARRWAPRLPAAGSTDARAWVASEMRRHDSVKIMEAGQAIGAYDARRWIGEVDVPTTVLVTERDRAIDPREQRKLAAAIDGAVVHTIDDGHIACSHTGFGRRFLRAVDSVQARVDAGSKRAAVR